MIPSRREDVDVLATNKQEEEDVEKRKMFVHLRQDLERVRNLCYMVNRREKLSRAFFKIKEQIFLKQVLFLEAISNSCNIEGLSKQAIEELIQAIMNANRGPAQYDKFYTSDQSEKNFLTYADIDKKILGGQKPATNPKNAGKSSNRGKNKKVNGASVSSAPKKPSVFMDSLSESDSDSESSIGGAVATTVVAAPATIAVTPNKKVKNSKESYSRRKRNLKSLETLSTTTSSSSDEETSRAKRPHKNDGLSRIEKEFEQDKARKICNDEISSNDSDDLIQIADTKKTSNRKSMVPIYSDTDTTDSNVEISKKIRLESMCDSSKMDVDGEGDNSHSQSQKFRTKAAKKEFTLQQPKKAAKTTPTDGSSGISSLGGGTTSGCETNSTPKSTKTPPKTKPKDSKRDPSDMSKFATELLVPQRQAAKKASENMRAPPTTDLPFVPQRQAAKKASENMKVKEVKDPIIPVKEKDKEEEKDEKEKDKIKSSDKSKGRGRPSKTITSSNRTKSKDSEKDFKESKKEDKIEKDDVKNKFTEKEKSKNKDHKNSVQKRKEKVDDKERRKNEERRKLEERKKEEESKREDADRLMEERKAEEAKKKEADKRKLEEEKRKDVERKLEEVRKKEEEKERKREAEKVRKREEDKEKKRVEEEKHRKREEEKRRKKEAEEKQKFKEAEELEEKKNDHFRKKSDEKKSKSSKSSSATSIAYVPQRQAAKKAAEHIKSGMVLKPPSTEQSVPDEKEKEIKNLEKKKAPIRRQSLLKKCQTKR